MAFPSELFAAVDPTRQEYLGWGQQPPPPFDAAKLSKADKQLYWGMELTFMEECMLGGGLRDYAVYQGAPPTPPKPEPAKKSRTSSCEDTDLTATLRGEKADEQSASKAAPPLSNLPERTLCPDGNASYYLFRFLQSEASPELKLQAIALFGGTILRLELPNRGRFLRDVLIGWGINGIPISETERRKLNTENVSLKALPDCSSSIRACDQLIQTLFVLSPGAPEAVKSEADGQATKIASWPDETRHFARLIMGFRLKALRLMANFYAATSFDDAEGIGGKIPTWRDPRDREKELENLSKAVDALSSLPELTGFLAAYPDLLTWVSPELLNNLDDRYKTPEFVAGFASYAYEGLRQHLVAAMGLRLYADRLGERDPRSWLDKNLSLAQEGAAKNDFTHAVYFGAALVLFMDRELKLTFRKEWALALADVRDLLPRENPNRKRFAAAHFLAVRQVEGIEKLLCTFAETYDLKDLYTNEREALRWDRSFHSFYSAVHRVTAEQLAAGLSVQSLKNDKTAAGEEALRSVLFRSDQVWLLEKCRGLLSDQKANELFGLNNRPMRSALALAAVHSIAGYNIRLPLLKTKVHPAVCGSSLMDVAANLPGNYREMLKNIDAWKKITFDTGITVAGLLIAWLSGGLATPVSEWLLARIGVGGAAESIAAGAAARSVSTQAIQYFLRGTIMNIVFFITSKGFMKVLLGVTLWNPKEGWWGNLFKPLLSGEISFLILGTSTWLSNRLAQTGLFVRAGKAALGPINVGTSTLIFYVLGYVNRTFYKVTSPEQKIDIFRGTSDAGGQLVHSVVAALFFYSTRTFRWAGMPGAENQAGNLAEQIGGYAQGPVLPEPVTP